MHSATMAHVYAALFLVLVGPVSSFTELHTLTQAATSYAVFGKVIAHAVVPIFQSPQCSWWGLVLTKMRPVQWVALHNNYACLPYWGRCDSPSVRPCTHAQYNQVPWVLRMNSKCLPRALLFTPWAQSVLYKVYWGGGGLPPLDVKVFAKDLTKKIFYLKLCPMFSCPLQQNLSLWFYQYMYS